MNLGIFTRIFCCILMLGLFLYAHITRQNCITELRLQIPAVSKELEVICQENTRYQFEIDQFNSPAHLMELSRLPQFSHLKYPLADEILKLEVF